MIYNKLNQQQLKWQQNSQNTCKYYSKKRPVICASVPDPQFKLKFFQISNSILTCLSTSASHIATTFEDEATRHFGGSASSTGPTENPGLGFFDDMYTSTSLEASSL
ncbi:hypothetical protein O181_019235 [Austropuccinia psidii MF-1]|uniref:Uncharacterized protein n=1 Tax=Austropuccinia psidii MF-1 TaxID=1389203 RepID=A0A9Q3CBE3_9BASI|nr:hypothetical protein [Austropuccinia psidii MF-1]